MATSTLADRVSSFFEAAGAKGVRATLHARPSRGAMLRSLLAGVSMFFLGVYVHDITHKDPAPAPVFISSVVESAIPTSGPVAGNSPIPGVTPGTVTLQQQKLAAKNAMVYRLLGGIDVLQASLQPQERCQVSSVVSPVSSELDASIACKDSSGGLASAEPISVPGAVFFKVGRQSGVDVYTSFSGQAMSTSGMGLLAVDSAQYKAVYFDEGLLNHIGYDFAKQSDRTLVLSFLLKSQSALLLLHGGDEGGLHQILNSDKYAVERLTEDFGLEEGASLEVARAALESLQSYYEIAASIGTEKTEPILDVLQIRLDAIEGERQNALRRQKQESYI